LIARIAVPEYAAPARAIQKSENKHLTFTRGKEINFR
jgi:hypothetical protein